MASGGTAGRAASPHPGQQQATGMPTPTRPALTSQQIAQEALRKQRKCVSCGNTALAKCDFRSCGTCCARAKNPCQYHGGKQASSTFDTSSVGRTQQFQWPAVPGMGMMQQYMRPASSMPYMSSGLMNNSMPYRYYTPTNAATKMPTPPVQTEASKALQADKAKKAYIQAQRDALVANRWRLHKLRDYVEAEAMFVDEAFDRYVRNVNWLEEAMMFDGEFPDEGLLESVADEGRVTDALRARYDCESKRKEQRLKLQRVIARSLQKLKGSEDEMMESMLELREFNQGRRDTKRMKVQTADGKECLRKINIWEDLFQGISSFSDMQDVSLFLDSYEGALGCDLGHSLPHLVRREGAKTDSAELPREPSTNEPSTTEAGQSAQTQEQTEPKTEDGQNDTEMQEEQGRTQETVSSGLDRVGETDKPMENAEEKDGEQPEQPEAEAHQPEAKWKDMPRVRVRKLVTAMVKESETPLQVVLDEQSLKRVYDNLHTYTLVDMDVEKVA